MQAQSVAQNEIHRCARRLVRVVHHRQRRARVDLGKADRRRGMGENNGSTRIELLPHGNEVRMSKVVIVVAEARHKHDAISMKFIQGVSDLGEAQLSFGRRRYAGEESVVLWVQVAHFYREHVQLARQRCGFVWVLLDSGTRVCVAQDGGLNHYALA